MQSTDVTLDSVSNTPYIHYNLYLSDAIIINWYLYDYLSRPNRNNIVKYAKFESESDG